ncbi:MAG: hypothetical protein HQL73_07085 [Magnetococcales bacterium]|nr:hypothetical protein [Magnetococcales bacterium]
MPETVTVEDVWKAFLETDRKMQETDRIIRESNRELREMIAETGRQMREMNAETDRMMQETDRMMQETDRKMQETDRKMQETDRKMQETDRKMQETDRIVKQVSRQIGQLGGRLGEFVEGLVKPACISMFRARGIPVDEVYSRVIRELENQRVVEIDLLAANTVAAIPIEVKSHLRVEDVRHHLARLDQFKSLFPRYASCQVYGAVAGMVIAAEADQFAMNQGLFVIVQSGESVRLANKPDFKPKIW